MTRVALDVLPVEGHDVEVLSALAGLGCAVTPERGAWVRVRFEAPAARIRDVLEEVLGSVAAITERAEVRAVTTVVV